MNRLKDLKKLLKENNSRCVLTNELHFKCYNTASETITSHNDFQSAYDQQLIYFALTIIVNQFSIVCHFQRNLCCRMEQLQRKIK